MLMHASAQLAVPVPLLSLILHSLPASRFDVHPLAVVVGGTSPPPSLEISPIVSVMEPAWITAHHPASVQFLCRNSDSVRLLFFYALTLSGGVTACSSEELNYTSSGGQGQCVYTLSDEDIPAFS